MDSAGNGTCQMDPKIDCFLESGKMRCSYGSPRCCSFAEPVDNEVARESAQREGDLLRPCSKQTMLPEDSFRQNNNPSDDKMGDGIAEKDEDEMRTVCWSVRRSGDRE